MNNMRKLQCMKLTQRYPDIKAPLKSSKTASKKLKLNLHTQKGLQLSAEEGNLQNDKKSVNNN